MQSVSSRIWTRVAVSIPYDNNHNTTATSTGKRQITEGRELPNQENSRTLGEKETYKYLRILETDTIK